MVIFINFLKFLEVYRAWHTIKRSLFSGIYVMVFAFRQRTNWSIFNALCLCFLMLLYH